MLAILLAYKSVLIPAVAAIVAWCHGRYARSADSKQTFTARAEEQASDFHEESGLDDLP